MTTLLEVALALLLLLVLIGAAIAPFEALGWWAGWFGEEADDEPRVSIPHPERTPSAHYLVYLSGIGVASGDRLLPEEEPFVAALADALPDTTVISDVFPYAVANVALTGRRTLATLWRLVERARLRNPRHLLTWLVNARNLFQVAVSADHRYGPFYNLGVARALLDGLYRHGYPHRSGLPITLVGSSGGAQIAVGAAPFLRRVTGAPVRVISLGGVMAADPGLLHLEQLWHFYGTRDRVPAIADVVFTGRWRLLATSPWNRARARGIVKVAAIGPMVHTGPGGYFDATCTLPNGQTYFEHTVACVVTAAASVEARKTSDRAAHNDLAQAQA